MIVGSDAAAAAKAAACLQAGAEVTAIAPEPAPDLAPLMAQGLRRRAREYRPGDLAGALLAYASTRDGDLVDRLMAEAEHERVLLNVIDTPSACTFFAPAVVDRGDLQIAIGTGGASPGLSARLRRELETQVGPEYAPFVAILGAVRRALASDPARAATRGAVLEALVASPLLALLRDARHAEIDALLERVAGDGCRLARLGITLGGEDRGEGR